MAKLYRKLKMSDPTKTNEAQKNGICYLGNTRSFSMRQFLIIFRYFYLVNVSIYFIF